MDPTTQQRDNTKKINQIIHPMQTKNTTHATNTQTHIILAPIPPTNNSKKPLKKKRKNQRLKRKKKNIPADEKISSLTSLYKEKKN